MKKLLALLLLSPFVLVSCSPKQYNYECLNGLYEVSIDDTKEVLSVNFRSETLVYKVPIYSVDKRTSGSTVYKYYFSVGKTKRFFSFYESDKEMFVSGSECTKV